MILSGKFMKKYYILKSLLFLFIISITTGCASTLTKPDAKHWHGKNYHKVE
jgi:uncharacterized protein YceK